MLCQTQKTMRLDIGPDGKIIGTRRVSPNGQVSGLSEFSGREVLVILPDSSAAGSPPLWPNMEEVTRVVGEQIREAYDRYRILQETYATPWEATRSFMEGIFGGSTPDLMAEVDRWIRSQVHDAPSRHGTESAGASRGRSEAHARNGKRTDDESTGAPGRKRP